MAEKFGVWEDGAKPIEACSGFSSKNFSISEFPMITEVSWSPTSRKSSAEVFELAELQVLTAPRSPKAPGANLDVLWCPVGLGAWAAGLDAKAAGPAKAL